MKPTMIAILILLAGTFSVTAQGNKPEKAQKSGEQKEMMMQNKDRDMDEEMMSEGRMRGQGMMMPMQGNMMQHMPMHKHMMMIKMLPNMQDKLSLTNEQANELIDMKAAFEKEQADMKAELSRRHMELKELLKDEAPAGEVETQLKQCADARVEMHVATYKTAQKMKEVLDEEQREKASNLMKNTWKDRMKGMKNK
ncbi:MAG: Spy/CpxP family protein refolding chaperone [Marinilabiliaceae bacterium]